MTAADFDALLKAEPFEPFTFRMTSGSEYTIDRPEQWSVKPPGTAEYKRPDGYWAVIALGHVVSVEFLAPAVVIHAPEPR